MRKSTLLLATLTATTLMAAEVHKKTEDFSDMNFFKNKSITVVDSMKAGDLTLVSVKVNTPQGQQKITVFVTKDRKSVIIGAGYDDKTGKQLLIPTKMNQFDKDAAITYGTGKKVLYVFSDPECPFCIKFEKEVLEHISLNEYTVHLYLFPLSFHKHSEAMSLYILSQKNNNDRIAALKGITNGLQYYASATYTENERTSLKAKLAKQQEIAATIGVSGTPAVYDVDGIPFDWATLIHQSNK